MFDNTMIFNPFSLLFAFNDVLSLLYCMTCYIYVICSMIHPIVFPNVNDNDDVFFMNSIFDGSLSKYNIVQNFL